MIKLTFDGSYSGKGRGYFSFILDDFIVNGKLHCYSSVEAEYKALIRGLEKAIQLEIKELTIYGDSKTVIHQITGQMKARKTREYVIICHHLLSQFDHYTLTWIPRRENEAHRFLPL